MPAQIGPASLPMFDDRLLYHLVDLLGDGPLALSLVQATANSPSA